MADRNIGEVLQRMLAEVPETETALRSSLSYVYRDAGFRPPEMMACCWEAAMNALWHAFGTPAPTEGWQGKVVRIFRGQE